MSDHSEAAAGENVAQTVRDIMKETGDFSLIPTGAATPNSAATLITAPKDRQIHDITDKLRAAQNFLKPARRTGTANLRDLDSLIAWANRFKGANSVLFANNDRSAPSLTCITDYHLEGPTELDGDKGDPLARHGDHRGTYSFPLSDEWKAWTRISGSPLDMNEMGTFIEDHALDIMDPTPAVIERKESGKNQDWENRLIQLAQQIDGRFGQVAQLLQLSRQFTVYETSNLEATKNRDTGEQSFQFVDEHKDKDGAPIKIPNLLIIAIPVFTGGALYRMPVRFQYRKAGSAIKFVMTVYRQDKAFDGAFDQALKNATEGTGMPLYLGKPEA